MSQMLAKQLSCLVLGLFLGWGAAPVLVAQHIWQQEGVASYYADYFHGRRTASGDRYDRNKLTAAHRTLPFGTQLRVTNLDNNQSVYVTVTDRGPFGCRRIIDLSYAAASKLNLIRTGVGRVRIVQVDSIPALDSLPAEPLLADVVFRPPVVPEAEAAPALPAEAFMDTGSWSVNGERLSDGRWGVQIGAFHELRNALDLGRRAQASGFAAFIQVIVSGTQRTYRVVLGNFETVQSARESVEQIVSAQLPGGFPVRHL
jgi:rare lipoprotein A